MAVPEPSVEKAHNYVEMTVGADMPELQEDTKLFFNDALRIMWTGNETMDVVAGEIDDADTENTLSAAGRIVTTTKGVFAGKIDLGELTVDDIHALVVPGGTGAWIRKDETRSLRVPFLRQQRQFKDNELSTSNIIIYDPISISDFTLNSGRYSIDLQPLRWGCAVARFNIYGKFPEMSDDEVLKSVKVTMENNFPDNFEVRLENDVQVFNSVAKDLSVTLSQECRPAERAQADGIKLYMALFPRSNTIKSITVSTDKASYVKNLTKELLPLDASKGEDLRGEIYRFGLNLASFDSRDTGLAYAGDDGTWSSSIPESFTKLKVRGNVTESVLSDIRTAAGNQAEAIDLDLGASIYESDVFPTVFAGTGTTAAKDGAKIRSIVFPSNVTTLEVEAFQYCSALQQVDLSTISTIGNRAFNYSGLTSVNVPNTVTSIGSYAFGRCFSLTDVYYNCSSLQDGSSAGLNRQTFSNRGSGTSTVDDNFNAPSRPLRFVFGPDVKVVPGYFFDSNPKLTEIVFECAPRFYSNWVIRCVNLRRIIIKSSAAPNSGSSSNLDSGSTDPTASGYAYNVGGNIPQAARLLVIPDGKDKSAYTSVQPWKALVGNRGFNFEDSIVYPSAEGWEVAVPEDYGYDSNVLAEIEGMMGEANAAGPTNLFVSVGGRQLYAGGDVTDPSHYIASCRKSILSMVYGKYVENGTIDLDETLGELGISDRSYVYGGQQYPGELTDLEKTATIFDIITSRSGIYHVAGYSGGNEEEHLGEWNTVTPGTKYVYNNWDFDMACHIFNLKVGKDFYDVLTDEFAVPMDLQDYDRSLQKYKLTRPQYSNYPAFPIHLSARDFARFGYLMLRGGIWNGQELVPPAWVQKSTSCITDSAGMGGGTRYEWGVMWWRFNPSWSKNNPNYYGAISAHGSGGQYLVVLPALDMVVAAKNKNQTGTIAQLRLILQKIFDAKVN